MPPQALRIHRAAPAVMPMATKRRLKIAEVIIVGGSWLRGQYGYPCFHCGATLKKCRQRKCCARCKGMRSHD